MKKINDWYERNEWAVVATMVVTIPILFFIGIKIGRLIHKLAFA